MGKRRELIYGGFKIRITERVEINTHTVTLCPRGGGYGTSYKQKNMNMEDTKQRIKNEIDSGVWDLYLNQPKPFTKDEETMIESEFDDLIEQLTDEQFWEYIKTWYTTEELYSMMANWNMRMKKEEIITIKKIMGEKK